MIFTHAVFSISQLDFHFFRRSPFPVSAADPLRWRHTCSCKRRFPTEHFIVMQFVAIPLYTTTSAGSPTSSLSYSTADAANHPTLPSCHHAAATSMAFQPTLPPTLPPPSHPTPTFPVAYSLPTQEPMTLPTAPPQSATLTWDPQQGVWQQQPFSAFPPTAPLQTSRPFPPKLHQPKRRHPLPSHCHRRHFHRHRTWPCY